MNLRQAFQTVTPTPVRRSIKKVLLHPLLYPRFKRLIEYEYLAEGWAAADRDPNIKGWNVETILEVYKAKWPLFVRQLEGNGPLGVAHETGMHTNEDLLAHNTTLAYAYALLTATREKRAISMLDWGGGIGHYYLISKSIVPEVAIDYHCKDVPVLAAHGRTLFPEASFYADDGCLDRSYDLVLASGAFHYNRDWVAMLHRMARAAAGHLFITRLPTVTEAPSYVSVQRPYSYGYDTEYLGWCLNRAELLRAAEGAGLELVREFVTGEQPYIDRAPEQPLYRGFLWRPAGSRATARGDGQG